jgi:hypothetical protein
MIRVAVLMNKHLHEPDLRLEIWVEFLDSKYVLNFPASFNRDFYVILTINLFWRVFSISDSDYQEVSTSWLFNKLLTSFFARPYRRNYLKDGHAGTTCRDEYTPTGLSARNVRRKSERKHHRCCKWIHGLEEMNIDELIDGHRKWEDSNVGLTLVKGHYTTNFNCHGRAVLRISAELEICQASQVIYIYSSAFTATNNNY